MSRFSAANQAAVAATKEDFKGTSGFGCKNLQLREEASKLEAFQLLFSGSDEESVQYRSAMHKKSL